VHATGWINLRDAAAYLGESHEGLRKKFEQAARLQDGVVEAVTLDGLRARKLGGRWKVQLGTWAVPSER